MRRTTSGSSPRDCTRCRGDDCQPTRRLYVHHVTGATFHSRDQRKFDKAARNAVRGLSWCLLVGGGVVSFFECGCAASPTREVRAHSHESSARAGAQPSSLRTSGSRTIASERFGYARMRRFGVACYVRPTRDAAAARSTIDRSSQEESSTHSEIWARAVTRAGGEPDRENLGGSEQSVRSSVTSPRPAMRSA